MIDGIKQLAEQAGMRTVTYEHDEDTYFTDSLDPQKFAELINEMSNDFEEGYVFLYRSFAAAIEAKLKELNHD